MFESFPLQILVAELESLRYFREDSCVINVITLFS